MKDFLFMCGEIASFLLYVLLSSMVILTGIVFASILIATKMVLNIVKNYRITVSVHNIAINKKVF
jgi:hypothetical protein